MKSTRSVLFGSGALLCAGLLLAQGGGPGCFPACPAEAEAAALCTSQPKDRDPAFSASPIFDARAPVIERWEAVARLGRDLSIEQVAQVLAFVQALPGPREKNLAALNLLKNDLISRLQDQSQPPAGLTATLIAIHRNPAQDPVARDYVLQHLITWSEQGAPDAPEARNWIQTVLRQATQEDTSSAGTALLGWHRLSLGGTADNEALAHTALSMLQSPTLPRASRLSAIQVCAEREVTQALPTIQSLAKSGGNIALRISAISALGALGGAEQVALLQQLSTEHNAALQPAIEGALQRLQARLLKNPAFTQNAL